MRSVLYHVLLILASSMLLCAAANAQQLTPVSGYEIYLGLQNPRGYRNLRHHVQRLDGNPTERRVFAVPGYRPGRLVVADQLHRQTPVQ
jgi:hypothetical protein